MLKVFQNNGWATDSFITFQGNEKIERQFESRGGPNISHDDDVNNSHPVHGRRRRGVHRVKVPLYIRRLHVFNSIQSAKATIRIV